jgi:hypothetical protein
MVVASTFGWGRHEIDELPLAQLDWWVGLVLAGSE